VVGAGTTSCTSVGRTRVWRSLETFLYLAFVARSDSAAPSAPPPPAASSDSESRELSRALSTPLLDLLDLPPRIASFAYTEGLETLGDLARISPDELLAERNLGRKSVGLTRRILEERTGVAWEEIACPDRPRPPSEPPEDPDPHGWDAIRKTLRDEHRRIPLVALGLSPGLRQRLEQRGLYSLGDLATLSRAKLLEVPGIGPRTLKKLPVRATDGLDELAAEYVDADRPLLGAFLRAVEELEAKRRLVIGARCGLEGPPPSLAEIAAMLDLSRERVRQLEEKALTSLRDRAWARHAEQRVEVALTDGPVPFAYLSGDPWWSTASENPALVAFIVERVLDELAEVVHFDGAHWLSRQTKAQLEDTWTVLVRTAENLVLPASELEIDRLFGAAVDNLGPCRHFIDRFSDKYLRR
jgi:hypothetical protein